MSTLRYLYHRLFTKCEITWETAHDGLTHRCTRSYGHKVQRHECDCGEVLFYKETEVEHMTRSDKRPSAGVAMVLFAMIAILLWIAVIVNVQ